MPTLGPTPPTTLIALETRAREVVNAAETADAAAAARDRAAADLFRAAVRVIGPTALRAIGTRPLVKLRQHNCDVNCRHPDEEARLEERCVHLGGYERAHKRRTDGTGGVYEGEGLFVREDGALLELNFTGTWTQWVNGWSSWEAGVVVFTDAEEAIEAGWDLADATEELAKALARYDLNAAGKRAEQFRTRAQQLTAVTTLIAK